MGNNDTLLITGASGHLGRRVTHHLLDTLGVAPERLILLTRDPSKLSGSAERGASVRAADFDDRSSLPAAMAGAQRVLLISTDAIGRRAEQHRNGIEAAREAGAHGLVYTSMPDPFDSKVVFAPEHAATEQAVKDSGIPGWTILRNHWYFENLRMTLPSMLASGKWFTAAGDGRVADVSRDDLALAAAQALVDQEGGATFTLSGPEALSTRDIADQLNRTLGTSIDVVPVPVEALIEGMVGSAGMPRPVAEMFASFDENTASGAVGTVTTDLERLIGRPPQSFGAWLDRNAASLRG